MHIVSFGIIWNMTNFSMRKNLHHNKTKLAILQIYQSYKNPWSSFSINHVILHWILWYNLIVLIFITIIFFGVFNYISYFIFFVFIYFDFFEFFIEFYYKYLY